MRSAEVLKDARRMHPMWIFFSIGKSIKNFFIPIFFYLVFNIQSDAPIVKWGTLAIILVVIYYIILTVLNWWHFRFLLTDEDLIIVEGRFLKEERFVSLERIQSVQLKRTLFHRLLGLTFLSFNTAAAGDESSIKLEVITRKEAERIQKHLSNFRLRAAENQKADEKPDISASVQKKYYVMNIKEVILASLTSLKLFAFIPILFAVYSKINDVFRVDGYINDAFTFLETSWTLVVSIIIVILVLSVASGIVVTYLRFGNFSVTTDMERIVIQKGVFSQTEFSIPKYKVQAIKVKKNLIRRWLGFVQVDLVSAGGVGTDVVEIASILFPFINEKKAMDLIPEILPAFKVEKEMESLKWASLFIKLVKPGLVWIFLSALLFYFFPAYWYLSLALIGIILIVCWLSYFNSAYLLDEQYVQLQSGLFTTELFITKRKKIDELMVMESWLERRFGLATLKVSTRAKPVHVRVLANMPKDAAVHYYKWYAEWVK